MLSSSKTTVNLMKVGSLVTMKNAWSMYSGNFGIVVSSPEDRRDPLVVLWSVKNSFKLQEHLEDSLILLQDRYPKETND